MFLSPILFFFRFGKKKIANQQRLQHSKSLTTESAYRNSHALQQLCIDFGQHCFQMNKGSREFWEMGAKLLDRNSEIEEIIDKGKVIKCIRVQIRTGCLGEAYLRSDY